MSVSTYKRNECGYNIDKLEKVVYLISEDDLRNIHIDNGEAYVDSISATPLSFSVYNIELSDTDELNERYKFTHTITFSMKGYANYRDFNGKYYAIVKTADGVYWLVNPLFPCKVTYTYTLDGKDSHTDFTLSTISNHPILRIDGMNHATPYECGYKYCKFDTLRLNESKYSLRSGNNVKYTNSGFKDIVFNKNSAIFTETFDGKNLSHSLQFNIKFDSYKSSWHYNLLEFMENKYAAIIKSSCGKYILTGFNFGLQPSFTVTANDDFTLDNIQINLIDNHDNGDFIGETYDEIHETKESGSTYQFTLDYDAYECVGVGVAKYLLKKEVDVFGNPTGNYKCLVGYEDRFAFLGDNLVGTFSETQEFPSSSCGGGDCKLQTSFPSSFVFNTTTCRKYSLIADTDWSITSSNTGITVNPNHGVGNQSYSVEVCNTITPTDYPISAALTVSYCDTTKVFNVTVEKNNTCLSAGAVFDITGNAQYVTVPTSCCVQAVTDPSSTVSNPTIQNSYFKVYVPKNNTGSIRIITLTVTFCNMTTAEVVINQGVGFERWVKESTTCIGNFLCDVERKYTGTTSSDINTRTNETRTVNCVYSSQCSGSNTRWIDTTETTCSNGRKYIVQAEQESTDGGQTWTLTGNKRLGSETADSPAECEGQEAYTKWEVEGYMCEETTKYARERLYTSTDNINWIATDTYRRTSTIIETNSTDCGYLHGSDTWKCEKWELDDGYICDSTTKYAREERFVRDCDNCSTCQNEWIATGIYRRTTTVLETDSTDCGYVTGDTYERWTEDGYMCDAYSKYKRLRRYISEDNEQWVETNIYKRGDLIEDKSFDCGYIPTEIYFDWRYEGTMCDGYNKFNRERKYISDNGNRWYATNIYRQGSLIESNSVDCGYVPRIEYEYQWVLTTMTICIGYDKYYLYKEQKRIKNSGADWEDVVPTETSYDGAGTKTPQLIAEDSPDCGYTPPVEPQYKWVLLDESKYICDYCDVAEFRWVTVNTYCNNIDKFAHQKLQYSLDGGATWNDVDPEETQEVLVEYNSRECGSSEYKIVSFGRFNNPMTTYCYGANMYTITENDVLGNEAQKANVTGATIGTCGTEIATNAFYGTSITALTIPSNITNIGNNAFGYSELTNITFESSTPPTIGTLIFSHSNIAHIYVPSDAVDAYKAVPNLSTYIDKIQASS